MPPKLQPSRKLKKEKKSIKKFKFKTVRNPKFTDEELNEEINIFLTVQNPYISDKCVEYDEKIKSFKPVFDYKKPVTYYRNVGSVKQRFIGLYGVVYEEVDVKEDVKTKTKFNFRSVATQTKVLHPSDKNEAVDLSLFPVLRFSGVASKAEIIAAYREHESGKKPREKNEWMRGDIAALFKQVGRRNITLKDTNCYYLKLCERMLDQNNSEANLDFAYYDNPNDEFRPNFGSLLPLWSLSNRRVKNMQVTCFSWNSHYPDLFAVGFRRMDDDLEQNGDVDNLALIRETGCICVFSLKGISHPEKTIECSSGVYDIQFHPQLSYLLVAAMSGGNLAVYNLKEKCVPCAEQDSKFEKYFHEDTVSKVQWLQDQFPQKLCSISFDGNIIHWSFLLSNLFPNEIVASLNVKEWTVEAPPKGLEMNVPPKRKPKDTVIINSTGTSVSVNSWNQDLILVGTISGLMHKYTFDEKACDMTFEGHANCIGRVEWNPFHPDVFLSCSKDMTVQIWLQTIKKSLFEFHFESGVKDAAWAPFSSTLFAVISGNAMIHVFDLAINKVEAIGTYAVYTQKQNISLTRVQFHPNKPILIIGDERGYVILFKLSPNLRSSIKKINTIERSVFVKDEIEKMDKILKISVEP